MEIPWLTPADEYSQSVDSCSRIEESHQKRHVSNYGMVGSSSARFQCGSRIVQLTEIVTTRDGIPNELAEVSALQRVFERAGISNESRIILYGEHAGMLAARAYLTLDYLGLADRAALLDGGLEKWRAEHRVESMSAPPVGVSHLETHSHPEILVSLAEMTEYSRSKKKEAVLIDARPNDEYTGAKFSRDVSKAGHIPNSVGIYWQNLLLNNSIPELKSADELRELFRASGASAGKEVITYCRTGMQSSFSYFVAKYLGYKSRMYDGSFYEWSRSPLPVEH